MKTQIPPDPSSTILNFVICEPILIGSFEVGYLGIYFLSSSLNDFLDSECRAGHRGTEGENFVVDGEGDIDAGAVGVKLLFRIASAHKNSIILNNFCLKLLVLSYLFTSILLIFFRNIHIKLI